MSRRTIMLIIAAVLVLTLAALAADAVAGQRQGMGAVKLQAFAKVLDLSPTQIADVKSILTNLRADVKAVIQSDKTRQEKRAEIVRLRGDAKSDIYTLLTSDQKAKADKNRLVDRLLNPRKARPMMRAFAALNLTPEQKQTIRGITKDSAADAKEIRQDTNLTQAEKRTRLQSLRQSTMEKIKSTLTGEQRDKLEQWLKSHRPGKGAGARRMGNV